MAARLLFGASSKRQGDLQRVEVDLRRGPRVLTTRVVDFNDKDTVIEGKGDEHRFVGGIGVEGYQKSNMIEARPFGPRLRHPRARDSSAVRHAGRAGY